MELTFRTIVILIIILVALLVFAGMIMGWGANINSWFNQVFDPLQETVAGR
jgi:hypothetical protein